MASAVAGSFDAIIVPSARTAPYLKESVRLADELECTLLVLCSGRSFPDCVADRIRREGHTDFVVIDMRRYRPTRLPTLSSSEFLASARLDRPADTSLKRNTGLALARIAGWNKVLFLDDDVEIPDASDLRAVAGLLDDYDSVGLKVGGQPDNSVVCYANLRIGGFQESFIGGGALGVSYRRLGALFPDIYNEDWFFLLDENSLVSVAEHGLAIQNPYDPFADPERARGQELGDVIAEGIFWLLDGGRKLSDATSEYWDRALVRRRKFISGIIAQVERESMDDGERGRMIASLKAARGRALRITPEHCAGFVSAWQHDLRTWRAAIDKLPTDNLISGLRYLRLWERCIGEIDGRPVGPRYDLRLNHGQAVGVPTGPRADRLRTLVRR